MIWDFCLTGCQNVYSPSASQRSSPSSGRCDCGWLEGSARFCLSSDRRRDRVANCDDGNSNSSACSVPWTTAPASSIRSVYASPRMCARIRRYTSREVSAELCALGIIRVVRSDARQEEAREPAPTPRRPLHSAPAPPRPAPSNRLCEPGAVPSAASTAEVSSATDLLARGR